MSDQPNDPRVFAYADYLLEYYIAEDSFFPLQIWAEANSTPTRTTNCCESFHSRLNASFYIEHPSLHSFIDVLLDFLIETYVALQSMHISTRKSVLDQLLHLHKTKSISTYAFVQNASEQIYPGIAVLSCYLFSKSQSDATLCFFET